MICDLSNRSPQITDHLSGHVTLVSSLGRKGPCRQTFLVSIAQPWPDRTVVHAGRAVTVYLSRMVTVVIYKAISLLIVWKIRSICLYYRLIARIYYSRLTWACSLRLSGFIPAKRMRSPVLAHSAYLAWNGSIYSPEHARRPCQKKTFLVALKAQAYRR